MILLIKISTLHLGLPRRHYLPPRNDEPELTTSLASSHVPISSLRGA